jgi:hypothetical protein
MAPLVRLSTFRERQIGVSYEMPEPERPHRVVNGQRELIESFTTRKEARQFRNDWSRFNDGEYAKVVKLICDLKPGDRLSERGD